MTMCILGSSIESRSVWWPEPICIPAGDPRANSRRRPVAHRCDNLWCVVDFLVGHESLWRVGNEIGQLIAGASNILERSPWGGKSTLAATQQTILGLKASNFIVLCDFPGCLVARNWSKRLCSRPKSTKRLVSCGRLQALQCTAGVCQCKLYMRSTKPSMRATVTKIPACIV
jgi:hypothetical protein